MVHIGIIRISNELILQWLDFNGGNIRNAKFNFNTVDLVIEHPDMPLYNGGELIIIHPSYMTMQDENGTRIVTRDRGGS